MYAAGWRNCLGDSRETSIKFALFALLNGVHVDMAS